MSTLIRAFTLALLALPAVFLWIAATQQAPLQIPALLVIAIYAWVWLRFRPTRFVVAPDAIEVEWPLKRLRIPRSSIKEARHIDNAELRRIVGRGMRVGAGGLWGGFGWLWTQRRGIVQMYVSRTDGYVWLERGTERPWLITPQDPDAFVRALR